MHVHFYGCIDNLIDLIVYTCGFLAWLDCSHKLDFASCQARFPIAPEPIRAMAEVLLPKAPRTFDEPVYGRLMAERRRLLGPPPVVMHVVMQASPSFGINLSKEICSRRAPTQLEARKIVRSRISLGWDGLVFSEVCDSSFFLKGVRRGRGDSRGFA